MSVLWSEDGTEPGFDIGLPTFLLLLRVLKKLGRRFSVRRARLILQPVGCSSRHPQACMSITKMMIFTTIARKTWKS